MSTTWTARSYDPLRKPKDEWSYESAVAGPEGTVRFDQGRDRCGDGCGAGEPGVHSRPTGEDARGRDRQILQGAARDRMRFRFGRAGAGVDGARRQARR